MQAKEGVIDVLNSILSAALQAINQYFVHAKICAHWGYARRHDKERTRSMGVMRDADALLGRILYLEGVPKVQRMPTVPLGAGVPEQLRLDLKAAREMLTLLSAGGGGTAPRSPISRPTTCLKAWPRMWMRISNGLKCRWTPSNRVALSLILPSRSG